MSSALPPEVARLLEERRAARRQHDFAAADALRERIAALGWQVEDGASGSTARPVLPPGPALSDARRDELTSLLGEPPQVAASLQVVVEDHPEDLARLARGLAEHPPGISWELVIVANAPTMDPEPGLAALSLPAAVLRTSARLGWADARNLGLRRSLGAVTVVLDTSLEPAGDFLRPLHTVFDDPTVGVAGPWGVRSRDGRSFDEAPPGEVHAVEAYCLAIRREALRAVGGFDPRFRFYRNADLDLSFAVRDRGWRAIRTETLPLTRHEHRAWAGLAEHERDRLSRRNFYRFLDHWRDRRDLLGDPAPPRVMPPRA